jgi:DNA-binding NarL/FixJ family response regulator
MSPRKPAVLDIQHAHALINAGLRLTLDAGSEFHVLPADSPSGQRDAADVVVLDHDAALQRRHPARPGGPNTLVVSTIGQDVNVRGALEAGVLGYVSASCAADEIRMAVRVVAAGRRYLCSTASICIADSLALPALTAREFEVLALVSRGRNNKEVARLLEVSVGTIKSHVRALLSKLGAQCRTEAMWIASQRGLIPRSEGLTEGARRA